MREYVHVSQEPEETVRLGARLGSLVAGRMSFALTGELGSGKTVLTRGICRGLDVVDLVTSPTFIVVNEYQGRLPVYHIDLYRIDSPEELDTTGFHEFTDGEVVTIVEWAEKAKGLIPAPSLDVTISLTSPEERTFRITPRGEEAVRLLDSLEARSTS
jgi:tRNA threonylcarbamoyladenosine biosynthesis protein TsaE